jgi:hypothetical protein
VVTADEDTTPKTPNKQPKAKPSKQQTRPQQPKLRGKGAYTYDQPGPWGKTGRELGSLLGGHYFGDPGKTIGGKLGSYAHYIGKIFGSGDYVVGPGIIGKNNLVNPEQVPEFQNGDNSVRIAHREYICDIYSSSTAGAFVRYDFPINPGLSSTFPWAGQVIGGNFQQYTLNGCVFEFHSNSSEYTTAVNQGYVVLATDYDSTDVPFTTKLQMENTQYAVSGKPSKNMLHAIECERKQTSVSNLYTRSGAIAPGTDLRMYDLGRLSVATGGVSTPNVMLGELWVSYDMTIRKPIQLQPSAYLPCMRAQLSLTTQATAPLTLTAAGKFDTIGVTFAADGLSASLPFTIPPRSVWQTVFLNQTDAGGAATVQAYSIVGSNGMVSYPTLPAFLVPNPTPAPSRIRAYSKYFIYDGSGTPNAPPTFSITPGGTPFVYVTSADFTILMVNGSM